MAPRGRFPAGTQRATNSVHRMIAGHIRRGRTSSGLCEADCAEKIGVSLQQFERYEQGTERVPASRLMLLAKVLGVPVSAFFERPMVSPDALRGCKIVPMMPALRRKASHAEWEANLLRGFGTIKT